MNPRTLVHYAPLAHGLAVLDLLLCLTYFLFLTHLSTTVRSFTATASLSVLEFIYFFIGDL